MTDRLNRLVRAVRRRPVRCVEAVLVVAAALGVTLAPELRESVTTLAGVLAPVVLGVAGGEAAQTRTRPTADDDVPGDGDPGLPGLPDRAGV